MAIKKKKAPNVLEHVEGENRKPIPFQKEGTTVTPTLQQTAGEFDTSIHVAGLTVATNIMAGGGEPAELVVTLAVPCDLFALSPAEACALAAALQAVAVHQMEQTQAVAV